MRRSPPGPIRQRSWPLHYRQPGYDAHAHRFDSTVEIRAVHVTGWRYPDGRWEFQDQPARIVAAADPATDLAWSLVDHRGELAVPTFGSVHAVAHWIACELPAPDQVTCRLERHPDFIDADSPPIPPDWYQSWQQQGGGHDRI